MIRAALRRNKSKGAEGQYGALLMPACAGSKRSTVGRSAVLRESANLMSEEWAVKGGKLANTFVYIQGRTRGTVEGRDS